MLGYSITKGTRVRAYRNLTKKCYSLQTKAHGRWLVSAHAFKTIHLTGVTFKVSQSGYQRYLKTAQRNVHAFIVGTYNGESHTAIEDLTLAYQEVVRVQYAGGAFVNATTKQPLLGAEQAWLTRNGVYLWGVTYAADR